MAGRPLKIEGGGDERLDFTYIDDLVDGLCLAISHPGARNQVFNMTYGAARSIAELVDVLRKEFPDVAVQHVARDRLMPFRGTLNVDRARRLIGYEPRFPIEKGFEEYVAWYRRRAGATR